MKFENYVPVNQLSFQSLVSLKDVYKEDIFEILNKAMHLKVTESVGEIDNSLKNTHVMLITNQRLGMAQLTFRLAMDKVNGHALTIPIGGSNIESFLSSRESVETLSKLGIDAFVVETSVEEDAKTLNQKMEPVINAYSKDSPVSAISDLLTIFENQKRLSNLKVLYLTCPQKLTSQMLAMAMCGMEINFVMPDGLEPNQNVIDYLEVLTPITITSNFEKALKNCDVLYIDNDFLDEEYIVDSETLTKLAPNACVLHTRPFEGAQDAKVEILDDPRCLIANAGANKVYVLAALLKLILEK